MYKRQVVKERIKKPTKVVKLFPYAKLLSLAASIALLIGLFLFLKPNAKQRIITTTQSQEFYLPDSSFVVMNKHSTIQFSKKEWKEGTRKLELDGEAYFKVKKGSTFSVKGSKGTVEVLGTAFNVMSIPSCQTVACYEGTVSVNTKHANEIITKGQAVIIDQKGKIDKHDTPILLEARWTHDYIHFSNSTLSEVIAVLERTYDIHIRTEESDLLSRKFTGRITQRKLSEALETVFLPLAISFEVTGNEVFLSN